MRRLTISLQSEWAIAATRNVTISRCSSPLPPAFGSYMCLPRRTPRESQWSAMCGMRKTGANQSQTVQNYLIRHAATSLVATIVKGIRIKIPSLASSRRI